MRTVKERFETKFIKDKSGDCWNWTACKHKDGYGKFILNGHSQYSHRVSYELYIGEIPSNSQVLHKCNNPSCVNPSHLFLSMNTVQERFEAKVEKDESGCWNWMEYKNHKGYGQFRLDGRMQGSHRVAFQIYLGEIPKGMCVCHQCDNPSCVNPDHLFLGTNADNVRDCVNKGRQVDPSGEKNGRSKLKEEDTRIIRMMCAKGVHQADIAKEFGVSQPTISAIVCGRTWTNI